MIIKVITSMEQLVVERYWFILASNLLKKYYLKLTPFNYQYRNTGGL